MKFEDSDLDFATEYNAAVHQGPPKRTGLFLFSITALLVGLLTWAAWAQLDTVARGEGRVVPSGKNQEVQSLEGGIVKEILVRPGAVVKKGDLLLRIDDTSFAANLGEVEAKRHALEASIVRLQHEVSGKFDSEPQFPQALIDAAPAEVTSQQELYAARQRGLAAQVAILRERLDQRQREFNESEANLKRLETNLKLAREEEQLKAPLAKSGVVPKTDLIRLQREIADLNGQIETGKQTGPRLEASVREAQALIDEQYADFRQKAQQELSDNKSQLAIVEETIRGAADRVSRTDIRAPVDGVVNKLNVNTLGGVVQAGETLVEIVPQEDSLRIEAKITPRDIAFVHPGQHALVKITAYDFSIYGGLEGEVEQISADSSIDKDSRQVFYLVTIKTLTNQLGGPKSNLTIFPGMVASVDIVTGKKSVLDYILKPINKAREEALRER